MLPIDMTSTWIPLGLLAVLCGYMVHLFRQERREALAFAGAEPVSHMPAPASSGEAPAASHAAPAAEAAPAPASHAPATQAAEAPQKKKRSLIWRGWAMRIWVPFIVGFGGQAYLDIIRPLVEKAAHH
ncbi:MAG: hypothetical protein P4L72_05295 [Parvibaculum sp.]|uniref:hypothetical protein n=1 Tax=Parvibaculum sp. TaxID=2024848 RepID=UPI00284EA80C|nr:hypothetical protein [Parvibaculum sp.]MDR3498627.1 hypothetical protein [Parvibaculum sp.]